MTKPCRPKVFEDPIVAEVRKAGEEMAREANNDLHALCERLREAERQHPERLVHIPPASKTGQMGDRDVKDPL